jgi:alkylated DNA repair dioxygenase AlkB
MKRGNPAQADLFAVGAAPPAASALPPGMVYETQFLNAGEERALVALIERMPLAEMRYKSFTARRRVASFGGKYDFNANQLEAAAPVPAELEPLRRKVAAWLGVQPADFTQVLVAEYREGTPLGWHRDVPDFEDVLGLSLLGEGVMRFRHYPPDAATNRHVLKLVVEARSIYLLRGPARWAWQHSVPPARELRYSITWRTSRARAGV